MKKNYSWALFAAAAMFFGTLQSFAVDYTISFTGSGKSTTVGSVEVKNLTRGTAVTVPGGDVLVLNVNVTALNPLSAVGDGLRISSNSAVGKSNVSFYAKQSGKTQINVYSIDGRKVSGITQNLQQGANSFQVSLRTGAYVISVQGNGYSYSGKLISVSNSQSLPEMAFVEFEERNALNPLKSVSASVTMPYVVGDTLLYKGISGNYATIVTDIPTASKTTDFNFIECKDASGNYYATVKIGNQTWMAENLRTTKYRTNATIPNLTTAADWGNTALVTGAWCYLDQSAANDAIYGKLYNWFAASDPSNIAPVGWHVPTTAEFIALADFLGGADYAGSVLKERGSIHWVTNPDGNNATGFTGRAGAKCNGSGVMNDRDYCYMWTTTDFSTTAGTCAFLKGPGTNLDNTYNAGKRNGFSIRCVLD